MNVAFIGLDHMFSALARGQAEIDWSSLARVAAREAGQPNSPKALISKNRAGRHVEFSTEDHDHRGLQIA